MLNMKNKRIGFFVRLISFGGGERIKLMLMNELAAKGYEIVIFTYDITQLNKLPFVHTSVVLPKQNNPILQFFSDFYNTNKGIKQYKIDLQVIFGFSSRFVLAARLRKIRSVVALRVDPLFAKNRILVKIRTFICFSLCDGIVFQTKKIKRRYPHCVMKKSTVIYNPIIDDDLPPIIFQKKYKKIVAVGRLSQEKNYPFLLKAFSQINNRNYTLHIYGDGPLKDSLKCLIIELGLENRTFLEGHVEKVVNYISDADIFVLASQYEGMPNALIEAMAMGLACISTKFPSGAAEELITDGVNGLLVHTNDHEGLKCALCKLIENPSLRKKLGENAAIIRGNLEKSKIMEQWTTFLENA